MVKVDNTWQEAIFYVKGALLQSLLEITKELQSYGATHIASMLKLTLKSQKKGAVKYSTLALSEYSECNDEQVLAKGVLLLDKFKDEIKKYNVYEPPTEELPIDTEDNSDDIPEY
jgi:hypothetical protein